VGHEGDWTIADYVADHRAPTPSAAASLVAPDVADLTADVEGLGRELVASSAGRLREASGEFLPWAEALPGSARAALLAAARSLGQLQGKLEGAVEGRLGGLGREMEAEALVLGTVDPRAVLSRGYALVSRAEGLITAASEAAVGEVVDVTLAKGWLRCRVLEKG
jgi:exodeoxyribonuclease VII large subunit